MASNAKFCSQCASPLPEPNPPFCSQCGSAVSAQGIQTPSPPVDVNVSNSPLSVTVNEPRKFLSSQSWSDRLKNPRQLVTGGIVAAIGILLMLMVNDLGSGVRIFAMILFFIFWLPSIIGFYRNISNIVGIFALNFFLGWTFIGWVIAVVWSVSGEADK